MREVLRRLNNLSGMRGSLVATPDGLPIASDLPSNMEVEETAGLGACMGRLLCDFAGEIGMRDINLGVLESNAARLFISRITWGFLIAVADKQCPLGEARIEMRQAAGRLNDICAQLSSYLQEEQNSENP